MIQDFKKWNDLWQTEDYWAIWLGVFLVALGLALYIPGTTPKSGLVESSLQSPTPFKTVNWHLVGDSRRVIRLDQKPLAAFISSLWKRPQEWTWNPIDSVYLSPKKAVQKRVEAQELLQIAAQLELSYREKALYWQSLALTRSFQDKDLNAQANAAIQLWRKQVVEVQLLQRNLQIKPYNLLPTLLGAGIALGILFGIAMLAMGYSFTQFLKEFLVLFGLGIIAFILSAQTGFKELKIGYPIWALLVGLIGSQLIHLPSKIRSALQEELFIKTGLVLLGAELMLGKILGMGLPAVLMAWGLPPVMFFLSLWIGRKLIKIDSKSLVFTMAGEVSVGGVPAAIAAATSSKAKKEELSITIAFSMVFTSLMILVLPFLIQWLDLPPMVGGAWVGSSVDATGAVIAAGEALGETAMFAAATVKMMQNIMIGVLAFGISLYWASRVTPAEGSSVTRTDLWKEFPKYLVGFVVVCVFVSVLRELLSPAGVAQLQQGALREFTRPLREWCFLLAFVSIGAALNLEELIPFLKKWKTLLFYVTTQGIHLLLTLLAAYLLFYLIPYAFR